MTWVWESVIILLLILLNGFFAGAEIALLSVRKTRLAELARGGSSTAALALRLQDTPERLLATVQVGITVVGATAAAVGGSSLQGPLTTVFVDVGLGEYARALALTTVVGTISALTIVLGELVPKSLALRASERFTLLVAAPLTAVGVIARPVAWLLTRVSNALLRPFGDQTTFSESVLSAAELRQLVEDASSGGAVHEAAGDIASRAIDLSSLRLASVLMPRAQVAVLEINATTEQVRNLLDTQLHSRFPVVSGGQQDVIGYVLARDLFLQLIKTGQADVREVLRKAHFLVESRPAVDALREMQREHSILAVVVDEHGTFAGIVTIEDIAEELVGDILAEHEEPESLIQPQADGAYLLAGMTPIRDVNRELGCSLEEGPGYTTIAGLVIHRAGHMVVCGDMVELAPGIKAEVLDSTQRQVRSIRLAISDDALSGNGADGAMG